MKNKKRTKRALFNSMVSLILCFTMLLGTTFAWFTDTETSGINQIIAGNLDVELYTDEGPIEESTKLFYGVDGNAMKWEPGAVAYENLTIANEGNLALKYELKLNIAGENATEEGNYKLSDVLQFAVVDAIPEGTSRKEVLEMATTKEKSSGSLTSLSVEGKLEPGTKTDEIGLVIFWEPNNDEVDNLYNLKNERNTGTSENTGWPTTDGKMLHIDLGINLYATQLEHEYDSFGNDYDGDASYIEAWDGVTTAKPAQDENGVYHITTAAELAYINTLAADFGIESGADFVLDADINLGNQSWTPIGQTLNKPFIGSFDGQGHTIYNLKVENQDTGSGLFGHAKLAVIENLSVQNVNISGSEWVGGLVGYATNSEIVNCYVANGNVIGDSKVGGINGYLASGSLTDSAVDGLVISGEKIVAGLSGRINADDTPSTVENNTISNSYIYGQQAAYFVSDIMAGSTESNNMQDNVVISEEGLEIENGLVQTSETSWMILNKEGLMNIGSVLAAAKPSEANLLTVDLMTDIDMTGETWTPIGSMWVTFNGNGHTISNLNCAKDDAVGRSGFWGYAGAVTMNDLTLKNVTSCGTHAGTFAGSAEGLKLNNCYLEGKNSVTWEAGTETWNGIGAITGVVQDSTINAEITRGTIVTLDKTGMTTVAPYVDELTGYISVNKGSVINNGTINLIVSSEQTPITVSSGTLTLKNVTITATEENPDAVTVTGDAKIVIDGSVTLTGAKGGNGIKVAEGAVLDLSGDTLIAKGNAGAENAGEKTAGGSGIGGEGTIYIHDMDNLTAEGYGVSGFGIGGNTESITIENTSIAFAKGGFVQPEITTDYGKGEPEGGAAIGSMYNGAVITLDHVNVADAKGGSKAAGIGGRYHTGVTVNIIDSTIENVEGGNASAGIGGSRIKNENAIEQTITINIEDSTITAKGGAYGAGIGSGYDTYVHSYAVAPMCDIHIKGDSVINAVGGDYAAGIGTGYHAGKLSGEIESTVTVEASSAKAVYKDTYTTAMGVGFGVLDPVRDGKDNASTFTWGDKEITVPSVSATGE